MALQYTGNSLVKLVRDRGMLPDTASVGTSDADILEHIHHALNEKILPFIMKLREEYFVVHEKVDLASGEERYRIPSRAAGNKLRDVYFQEGTERRALTSMDRSELANYADSPSNRPYAFYLEGNHVVLFPELGGASGELRMAYYFRPSQLQLQEAIGRVSMVDTTTRVVTLEAWPTVPTQAWTTSLKFDAHSEHSGAEIHQWDLTASGVDSSAKTITFSDEIDSSIVGRFAIQVGDYICLAEECGLPPIPREAHAALGQAALCRILHALGDHENLQFQKGDLNEDLQNLTYILNARIESKPKILNNRNSIMATSGGFYR